MSPLNGNVELSDLHVSEKYKDKYDIEDQLSLKRDYSFPNVDIYQ